MSPTVKKVLMIAGAAVAGYVVYTKVIKKPAPTKLAAATSLRNAAITKATVQLSGNDLLEELGLEEALGSLGGKRR